MNAAREPLDSIGNVERLTRIFSIGGIAVTVLFLLHTILTFWFGWPGFFAFINSGLGTGETAALTRREVLQGWTQISLSIIFVAIAVFWIYKTPHRGLTRDAELLTNIAAYIVRAAFWAVLLIGLVDTVISFLRVEGALANIVSEELNKSLGRPKYRGLYVHYPLIVLSMVIAFFSRSLGFIWLSFLVVIAEFQIVIWRFIFSYEQAFMGDLVRFWYAALFLFASAYALVYDGHVRVDVFYAKFSERKKAWVNLLGSILLGLPLCWTILIDGMWTKTSSLNSPLLSYEISQSGYGMYVKYLMAGFLIVFAVSMIFQFSSYVLSNVAIIRSRDKTMERT